MEGDGQRKVLPVSPRIPGEKLTMRVSSKPAEGKGPLSLKFTMHPEQKTDELADGSSSGSDVQNTSSSSSQDVVPVLPEADVNFEKMIGESMVEEPEPEVIPLPVPTPRKRGRPRKTQHTPLVDPLAWTQEQTSTPSRSRRQRKEAPPMFLLPKRRRRRTAKADDMDDKKDDDAGSEKNYVSDDSKLDEDYEKTEESDGVGEDFPGPKSTPRKKKRSTV